MHYRNKKVLIVGDTGVDIIVHYPKFLNKERTNVEYKTPVLVGGGTAANTAVSLQKLDINTSFLGTIGDDQYGKYVVSDFIKEGIDIDNLIIDEKVNTVGVFAFIDEFGERYLWGWPRTEQGYKKLDLEKINYDNILNSSWIHSSGMIMVDDTSSRYGIIEIFKKAYEAGITTSFDLNLRVNNGQLDEGYKQSVLELLKYCNYILGSGEEEFYFLNPQENWVDSAKSFVTDTRTVIARMGSKGSMAITTKDVIVEDSYPVKVCDTVGAGDVYNGGFIAARLMDKDLRESIKLGNAVAAYTVAREGARSSPTMKEVEKFLKQYEGEEH